MAVQYSTPQIFAKKYSTLVRYAFFVMVQYASKIELKYYMLVWYSSRGEVCSMQILNVLYRTAILAWHTEHVRLYKQIFC